MMARRLIAAAAATAAISVGIAAAAPTAPKSALRLMPNIAGRGTTLKVDVDPRAADAPDETARELAVSFQRGFGFDARAVKGRCSADQAEANTCPANSRIGSGTANGTYTLGAANGTFTATIDVFLADPLRASDAAGLVVSVREPQSGFDGSATGRVVRHRHGRFGYEERFDLSGTAEPPAGATIEVQRVRLRLGASRRGHDLITNPSTCDGEYLVRLTARYANRPDFVRDARPDCRPARKPLSSRSPATFWKRSAEREPSKCG